MRQGSSRAMAIEAWLNVGVPAAAPCPGSPFGRRPLDALNHGAAIKDTDHIFLDQAGGRAWGAWRPSVCAGTPIEHASGVAGKQARQQARRHQRTEHSGGGGGNPPGSVQRLALKLACRDGM